MNATINTVKSNIRSVVTMTMIVEEINGQLVHSVFGQSDNAPSLFAPAKPVALTSPLKSVELNPPAPVTASKPSVPTTPEVKPTPAPTSKLRTLDEAMTEAKALKVKGAHMYKDVAKLEAAIAAKKSTTPAAPVEAAKPKGGSGFKGKTNDSNAAWHPLEGTAKVVVWKKDRSKQFTGYAVKAINTGKFTGILFLLPDEKADKKPGWMYGITWPVPNDGIVSYID